MCVGVGAVGIVVDVIAFCVGKFVVANCVVVVCMLLMLVVFVLLLLWSRVRYYCV